MLVGDECVAYVGALGDDVRADGRTVDAQVERDVPQVRGLQMQLYLVGAVDARLYRNTLDHLREQRLGIHGRIRLRNARSGGRVGRMRLAIR